MKALGSLLVTALAVALPKLALACPSCAGREEGGISRSLMVGAMIAVPFLVSIVVFRAIRREGLDDPEVPAPSPPRE